MKSSLVTKAVAVSKFKGSLIGALVGDCLGAPFEGENKPNSDALQEYFDKMENPSFKSPVKRFTDDTAMTSGMLESFVELGFFDERDLANRFVTNYFREPNRGYGESVVTVFKKLKQSIIAGKKMSSEADLWKPAQEQFNGSGSLGNGGAMRIAPVALYCYSNYDLMLSTAEKCTRLTHTHKLGINGALLQVIAVQQSLLEDPSLPLDIDRFITEVIEKMSKIENVEEEESGSESAVSYLNQLEVIKKFLMAEHVSDEDVIDTLGNSIRALYSVPTALYCFLRAQRPIESIETENKFRRVIQYSISLGGDTDTIASMAGAISGAYHGFEYIDKNILNHCEAVKETLELAQLLHSIAPTPSQCVTSVV